MADTLVNSLLMSGKDNKKTLESMEKTLKDMFAHDKEVERKRQSERREDKQNQARRDADRKRAPAAAVQKRDEKKENGGGFFGGLMKALGGLATAIGGLGLPLLGNILKGLGTVIGAGLKLLGPLAKAVGVLAKPLLQLGGTIASTVSKTITGAVSSILPKGGLAAVGAGLTKIAALAGIPITLAGGAGVISEQINKNAVYGGGKAGETGLGIQDERGDIMKTLPDFYRNKSQGQKNAYLEKNNPEAFARLQELNAADAELKRLVTERDKERDGKVGTGKFKRSKRKVNGKYVQEEIMRSRTDEEKAAIEAKFQNDAMYVRNKFGITPGKTSTEKVNDAAQRKIQETQNALMESLGLNVEKQEESTKENTKAIENLDRQLADLEKALGDFDNVNIDFTKKQTGGPITVPGTGSGDKVPMMLPSGSFVLNRNASNFLKRQTGGVVPTMLEPGELVYLNENIKRFQSGGEAKTHPILEKLNDENIVKVGAAPGLCVTGSLNTMQASGVPNPAATGQDVGNNPRGAIVQLINSFGWGSMGFGSPITLESPYGNATAMEMSAQTWDRAVADGKIPSGALVFQTRHDDWNGTSSGSRGYDMAIAQKSGNELWNGQSLGSRVYSGLQKVIALTPGGGSYPGNPDDKSGSRASKPSDAPGRSKDGEETEKKEDNLKLKNLATVISGLLSQELAFMQLAGMDVDKVSQLLGAQFGVDIDVAKAEVEKAQKAQRAASGKGKGTTGDSAKSNKPYDIAASMGFSKKDWDIYRNVVGNIESGNKYNIAGGSGGHYDGRWQLGDAAKTDAASYLGEQYAGHGDAARRAFQKDADMQERYFAAFTAKNHSYLSGNPAYDKLSTREKFQVLGYAHNQGAGGAADWLATGEVRRDGFGTAATKYSTALAQAYGEGKKAGGKVSTGGSMVPTLLEPGEKVFMPGQWDSNISTLNKAIPRFQTGGVVGMTGRGMTENEMSSLEANALNKSGPQIVTVPVPMEAPVQQKGNSNASIPAMPSGPSVAFLSDVINRTNMGGVFS